MSKFTGSYQSPLGLIEITSSTGALTEVKFLAEEVFTVTLATHGSEIIDKAISQLKEYFDGKRNSFDMDFEFSGTDFQQKVWQELTKIPFGQTLTYSQLAYRLGSYDLTRAVGTACGSNPLAIFVPCHRVVGKGGDLTGYAGGLWRKQWLLEHEGCQSLLPIW